MKKTIMNHLTTNRSYFKWSAERIARKFNCSINIVNRALTELATERTKYLTSLKG